MKKEIKVSTSSYTLLNNSLGAAAMTLSFCQTARESHVSKRHQTSLIKKQHACVGGVTFNEIYLLKRLKSIVPYQYSHFK